uniref:Uncharacterized protein n=1 Tax=Anopheles culicifacies TaxID=139723 RepID=A0A182MNV5_9DIPT
MALSSCFENLRKFVRYFAYDLLIAGTALRLFAEDAGKDLHEILLSMLMFRIVGVAQYLSAQLQVPFANLRRSERQTFSKLSRVTFERAERYRFACRQIGQLPYQDVNQHLVIVSVENSGRLWSAKQIDKHF